MFDANRTNDACCAGAVLALVLALVLELKLVWMMPRLVRVLPVLQILWIMLLFKAADAHLLREQGGRTPAQQQQLLRLLLLLQLLLSPPSPPLSLSLLLSLLLLLLLLWNLERTAFVLSRSPMRAGCWYSGGVRSGAQHGALRPPGQP